MGFKSLLSTILDYRFGHEPCSSCEVARQYQSKWGIATSLQDLFKCEIDPQFPRCPFTGREMPWAVKAMYLFVDDDDEEEDV